MIKIQFEEPFHWNFCSDEHCNWNITFNAPLLETEFEDKKIREFLEVPWVKKIIEDNDWSTIRKKLKGLIQELASKLFDHELVVTEDYTKTCALTFTRTWLLQLSVHRDLGDETQHLFDTSVDIIDSSYDRMCDADRFNEVAEMISDCNSSNDTYVSTSFGGTVVIDNDDNPDSRRIIVPNDVADCLPKFKFRKKETAQDKAFAKLVDNIMEEE